MKPVLKYSIVLLICTMNSAQIHGTEDTEKRVLQKHPTPNLPSRNTPGGETDSASSDDTPATGKAPPSEEERIHQTKQIIASLEEEERMDKGHRTGAYY